MRDRVNRPQTRAIAPPQSTLMRYDHRLGRSGSATSASGAESAAPAVATAAQAVRTDPSSGPALQAHPPPYHHGDWQSQTSQDATP